MLQIANIFQSKGDLFKMHAMKKNIQSAMLRRKAEICLHSSLKTH